MTRRAIDRFFAALDRAFNEPVTIIVTGGAAANLRGTTRTTRDIDFEVRLPHQRRSASQKTWEAFERAVSKASRETGVEAQYAADIDRWSSIALPPRRRRPELYRWFGRLRVCLLDPVSWAVGKLARGLDTDLADVREVLAAAKPAAPRTVRTWAQALGSSPPSSAQALFRRQTEEFLRRHARVIWGRRVNPEALIRLFLAESRRALARTTWR